MQSAEKIGILFYDAAGDYRSHLLALLLSKPFLAEPALIILSNSNWDAPRQAHWDFVATLSVNCCWIFRNLNSAMLGMACRFSVGM